MTLLQPLRFLGGLVLASSVASCGPAVEPAFSTEQYYSRDLVSREECAPYQFISEFTCRESATFKPDGNVNLMLGGSDVLYSGTYQRKGKRIGVTLEHSSSPSLSFEVISDTTIKQIETGTIWTKPQ